jgi:pimeloyl-ACP methyl ester carboxylesterase
MLDRPEVRYAVDRWGTHLAFQRFGTGPALLLLAGWATNLDGMWREPGLALFLRRLAAMRSVVMFDKRGVGLSDPASDVANAGDAVEDVLVVLEACGLDSVEVLAAAEASFVAVPLAAFHPERVRSLVLVNGTARTLAAPGYPEGIALSSAMRYTTDVGSSRPRLGLSVTAPSRAGDPSFRRWAAEYQRAIASPGVSRRIINMIGEADVRGLLGSVRCPTIVVHKLRNQFYSVDAGRVMAAGIPAAQFIEVDGADHLFWVGDVEPLFAAIDQVG